MKYYCPECGKTNCPGRWMIPLAIAYAAFIIGFLFAHLPT